MSTEDVVRVTYCNFPTLLNPSKFYLCYNKEQCCNEGCCIGGPYEVYHIWIFIIIVLGIISGTTWLCKKPQPQPRHPTACSYVSQCNRRRCSVNMPNGSTRNDDVVLERLFLSFRNRANMSGDPPSYSSVVSSSGPKLNSSFHAYCGPPPTYSSTYHGSVARRLQPINEDNGNATTIPIEVHVEEDVAGPESAITGQNSEQLNAQPEEEPSTENASK